MNGNVIRKHFVGIYTQIYSLMDKAHLKREILALMYLLFRDVLLKVGSTLESPRQLLILPTLGPHARSIQSVPLEVRPDIIFLEALQVINICSHIWELCRASAASLPVSKALHLAFFPLQCLPKGAYLLSIPMMARVSL